MFNNRFLFHIMAVTKVNLLPNGFMINAKKETADELNLERNYKLMPQGFVFKGSRFHVFVKCGKDALFKDQIIYDLRR